MKVAVALNYELLGSEQIDVWNRFSDLLAQREMFLLLVTTNTHPGLKCSHLDIPYGLAPFADLRVSWAAPFADLDRHIADEEAWLGAQDEARVRQGALKCRRLFDELMEVLSPDVVFVWNALLPQSAIARDAARAKGIPALCLERGLLPGTWLCEAGSNVVGSELSESWVVANALRSHRPNHDRIDAYRRWYLQRRPAKYEGDGGADSSDGSEPDGPLTLVLGQVAGTLLRQRHNLPVAHKPPPFRCAHEALAEIRMATPNRVVFRDHPINAILGSHPVLPEGVVQRQSGTLLHALEPATEVIAFGYTTAIYEALILRKPVLTLGQTPMHWLQPAYSTQVGELHSALEAMRAGGFAGIEKRAMVALSWLLEVSLIGLSSDVPCKHTLADFSRFAASFQRPQDLDLSPRLDELQGWAARVFG